MQSITIILNKKDLFFEVKNKLYTISESRKTADNLEAVDYIKVNDDTNDQYRVLSSFSKSKNEVETLLSKYSLDSATITQNETIDTTLTDTLAFALSMPDNFANNAKLSNAIHNYLVDKAIFDWLMVAAPNEATPYQGIYTNDLQEIVLIFNKRSKPIYAES
jgi:hypothetical protein